ncbi:hypothetical protein Pla175_35850 [Pirellulimonas nuda]|uniref:Uncharacterized protein n=1 Tax=Pirellulimonas nuda TaxID=2528009 RepID=A0A518DFC6_9BACT|nr:hypothetical protein [Pirellulimonas nuda]QDU90183.1 hypothetical protein Pla175_35850 [Pirellulimonas nuda]
MRSRLGWIGVCFLAVTPVAADEPSQARDAQAARIAEQIAQVRESYQREHPELRRPGSDQEFRDQVQRVAGTREARETRDGRETREPQQDQRSRRDTDARQRPAGRPIAPQDRPRDAPPGMFAPPGPAGPSHAGSHAGPQAGQQWAQPMLHGPPTQGPPHSAGPAMHNPYAPTPPAAASKQRVLRDMAFELERHAHGLENLELYNEADGLRSAAAKLRQSARKMDAPKAAPKSKPDKPEARKRDGDSEKSQKRPPRAEGHVPPRETGH